jgi:flagellar biosynthesis protein FlhG
MGGELAVNDQAQHLRDMARNRSANPAENAGRIKTRKGSGCRSIAVTGGKGGIGKSNISLFLALSLSRLKQKVLVLDADLGLANIHILLGIAPKHNLAHMIRGECSVQDILYQGPEGITIIPGATGIEEMANLDATRMETLLRGLNEIENLYNYLVIDVGAGIGRTATQIGAFADTALLVLTPEPTALADVYATVKMLVSRGATKMLVLVNMAATEKEGQDIFEKLETLTKSFLNVKLECAGILPVDPDIPRLVRAQKNLLIEKPGSGFSRRIQNCARLLCGMPPMNNDLGFFMRLFSIKS